VTDTELLLNKLADLQKFNRNDLQSIMISDHIHATDSTVNHMIIRLLQEGYIVRVGRNQYSVFCSKRLYKFPHSEQVLSLAEEMKTAHPFLDFRVFELTQLNEFVNHQIAHNIIFLSVEGGLEEDVFYTLWEKHNGSVMLKPSIDDLYRYMTEDIIVIGKRATESPKGIQEFWDTRLEKMLVDIAIDKLLKQVVYEGEYPAIFHDAIKKYVIDKNTMARYARRRGALEKYRIFLKEKANLEPDEIDI